jgi:Tol biopolymer transport system component
VLVVLFTAVAAMAAAVLLTACSAQRHSKSTASRRASRKTVVGPQTPGIYSVSIDGSNVFSLHTTGDLLSHGPGDTVALSPPEGQLAVMKEDGSARRVLVRLGGGRVLTATADAWSPAGARLAVSISGPDCLEDCGDWSIWLLDIRTGTRKRVIANGDQPAWSPDGSMLAFTNHPYPVYGAADHTSNKPDYIYIASVKGGPRRWVARGDGPTWLPDSKRVAYEGEETVYSDVRDNAPTGFEVVSVAGDRALHVAQARFDWAVSPDGAQVAGPRLPDERLAIVHIAGGAVHYFTRKGEYAYMPRWAPDGAELAWLESDEGQNQTRLLVGPASGEGHPRVLARVPGGGSITSMVFTADGQRVIYSVDRR